MAKKETPAYKVLHSHYMNWGKRQGMKVLVDEIMRLRSEIREYERLTGNTPADRVKRIIGEGKVSTEEIDEALRDDHS